MSSRSRSGRHDLHKAFRYGRLLACVIAALVASCASSQPAAPEAAASSTSLLIDHLASRYAPRHEEGSWELDIHDPPDDRHRADEDRVQAVEQQLKSLGVSAFPALIAATDNKRFSKSQIVAALNRCIGP